MGGQDNVDEEEVSGTEVEAERQTLQERIDRWLDLPMAILSLIWVGLLVVELALPLSPELSDRILKIDIAIWVIFVIQFVVEFSLAPRKKQYLRSNVLIALSLVLPFIRIARVLRLTRVLRSISLVRITLVANRATTAIGEIFSRHKIHYVLALTGILTILGAASVYFFEQGVQGTPFRSFWDALWWSATMVTTINIGTDPVTFEGRLIAILLRAFAMGVFGFIAASFASYFVGQRIGERRGLGAEQEVIQQLILEISRLNDTIERLQMEVERINRRTKSGKDDEGDGVDQLD